MADMEEESLALLFAVVADVDPGLDLLRNDPLQGRMAGPFDFGRVCFLPTGAPGIEPRQFARAREASRVSSENAVGAVLHEGDLELKFAICAAATCAATEVNPIFAARRVKNSRIGCEYLLVVS